MKFLLIFVILIGCTSSQICESFKPLAKSVGIIAQAEGGCDPELVEQDILKAFQGLGKCPEKGIMISELKTGGFQCDLVPGLMKILANVGTSNWNCTKVGYRIEDALKKVFKCNG